MLCRNNSIVGFLLAVLATSHSQNNYKKLVGECVRLGDNRGRYTTCKEDEADLTAVKMKVRRVLTPAPYTPDPWTGVAKCSFCNYGLVHGKRKHLEGSVRRKPRCALAPSS